MYNNKLLSILLVEDNSAEAELIEELLDEVVPDRFAITRVKSLKEAIANLKETAFDVILLDLSLPDSWGIETIVEMKAKTQTLPIVVLTALNDRDAAIESVRSGAQDYLVKGKFEGELLIRAIRYAIERHRIEAKLRQQAKREKLMARTIDRIRNSLDLPVILQTTVEEVRHFLKTDRVCIAQFKSDKLDTIAAESVSLSYSGRGQFINPSYIERESLETIAEHLVKTILIVPIWKTEAKLKNPYSIGQNQKQLWGQLIVHNYHESRVWEEWEIDFLNQLASQVAIAIQQSELYRRLQELASLDGLTQVANRRHFNETLDLEWHRLAREQKPLSLILCDVDHFKKYNDTYGHPSGDLCLQLVAKAIQRAVKRSSDVVARYGGEEFAVILPDTDDTGATVVAEKIRQQILALQIPHRTSATKPYVTISLGIATNIPSLDLPTVNIIEAADRALFQAKAKGRDRIVQNC